MNKFNKIFFEAAENSGLIEIKELQKEKVQTLMEDKVYFVNLNPHANPEQIKKLFKDVTDLKYLCILENNILKGVLAYEIQDKNICFIREAESFECGKSYGEKLISTIVERPYSLIWCTANWEKPDEEKVLCGYYLRPVFHFKEYISKTRKTYIL